MRKIALVMAVLLLCMGLCSCGSSELKPVTSYTWVLETATHKDGSTVFSGPALEDSDLIKLDLFLYFEEETFRLEDRANEKEWTGTYSAEMIDNTYKMELVMDDPAQTITGVCGMRTETNGKSTATMTLTTTNFTLLFDGIKKII